MKTNWLALFLIILLVSCTEIKKAEEEKSKTLFHSTDSIPYERIDSLLSISDDDMNRDSLLNRCDPNHRQILINVTKFSVVHSNYYNGSTNKIDSQRSIKLQGKNSRSSCKFLNQAYLVFKHDFRELRKPEFVFRIKGDDTLSAEIRLYYPDEYFDAILSTLINSKDIFCWRGVFPGGDIYGDIHIPFEN